MDVIATQPEKIKCNGEIRTFRPFNKKNRVTVMVNQVIYHGTTVVVFGNRFSTDGEYRIVRDEKVFFVDINDFERIAS